ncbi:MAG: hypothetical protein ABIR33_17215 [Pyrinomonadaceae bacterium]
MAVIGFALLLLLPSLDIPLKYGGVAGMIGYLIAGLVGLTFAYYKLLPIVSVRLSENNALWILLLTITVLAVFALVLYPIANSGRFGGGTDVDDALIIGVTEIAAGRYPYYQQTYLGGLLSPMPGAILLSFPFVLSGLLPLQNIFWIGALSAAARTVFGSFKPALMIVLTVVLVSPTAYQVIAVGSDHMSNAIYILISMWLLVRAVANEGSSSWQRLFPAILLGISLSSRSNFLVLTPILFSVLLQNSNWKVAARYCSIAAAVFLAVTIPFWLYDPPAFSPYLIQSGRLENMRDVLPHAPIIVPAISFILAAAASLLRMGKDCAAFFRNCAVVQILILYISSLPYAAHLGEFSLFLGNIGYGMFTVFFAAVSIWIYMSRTNECLQCGSRESDPEAPVREEEDSHLAG